MRILAAALERQAIIAPQLANISLIAGQANQALKLARGKVAANDRRPVALAIDADKDKGDMGRQLIKRLANPPKFIKRQRTNIGAVRIAKGQQRITSAQIAQTHPLAMLIGQDEIRHTTRRFYFYRAVKILDRVQCPRAAAVQGAQAIKNNQQREADDASRQANRHAIQDSHQAGSSIFGHDSDYITSQRQADELTMILRLGIAAAADTRYNKTNKTSSLKKRDFVIEQNAEGASGRPANACVKLSGKRTLGESISEGHHGRQGAVWAWIAPFLFIDNREEITMGDWKTPKALKYAESDEWFSVEGDVVTIGITDYAQDQLNDIVYIELKEVGDALAAGDSFGEVESVKAAAEMYSAAAGEIIKVNADLEEAPEIVNADPFGAGWMVKIRTADVSALDGLMDAAAYDRYCDSR